jgi:hypothetical protein
MNGLRHLVAGWVALVGWASGPAHAAGLPLVVKSGVAAYARAVRTGR